MPKFDYYLDESDPDIVVLRRQDGSFAATFSAQGTTREDIVEAAKDDSWKLIEANACGGYGRKEEVLTAPDQTCALPIPRSARAVPTSCPAASTGTTASRP